MFQKTLFCVNTLTFLDLVYSTMAHLIHDLIWILTFRQSSKVKTRNFLNRSWISAKVMIWTEKILNS